MAAVGAAVAVTPEIAAVSDPGWGFRPKSVEASSQTRRQKRMQRIKERRKEEKEKEENEKKSYLVEDDT